MACPVNVLTCINRNHDLHEQIENEKQRIETERKLQEEEDEENLRRYVCVFYLQIRSYRIVSYYSSIFCLLLACLLLLICSETSSGHTGN